MRSEIYNKFLSNGFKSLGKNKINHPDIQKCFTNKEGNRYAEIYKERYGLSIHLYGFSKRYLPLVFDVMYRKDVKELDDYLTN